MRRWRPVPSVVRSTVASWQTTSAPSAVAWTSSSMPVAPAAERGRDGVEGGRRALPRPALVGVGDDPALRATPRPACRAASRARGSRKNGSLCPAMLDHVFTQLVASHRHAFEAALLQRQAVEERFQVDVFLGDVSFETSYSLPGEERPARIRVDTSLDWPTWSQTAYRSWAIGEEPDELPEVLVEIAFRVQGLDGGARRPALLARAARPPRRAGASRWSRGPATIEQVLARRRTSPSAPSRSPTRGRAPSTRPSSTTRAPRRRPGPPRPGGGLGPGPHRRPPLHLPTGGRRLRTRAAGGRGRSVEQPGRPPPAPGGRPGDGHPTWEMISAAHTPPSRADSSGDSPLVMP